MGGAGADTIGFSVSGTITLGSTLPAILSGSNITIGGTGQSVTVSGNNAVGVMVVNGGATLHLQNLTVANGNALLGGGIQNNGTLTVTNSTFSGNSAAAFGGGIRNSGTLTVTNSTFSGNSARFGGGIENDGTLTVTNSTFSGNTFLEGLSSGGGGINNDETLSVTNSTFSGNSAGSFGGGGIRSSGGSLTHLSNTLIANSPSGGDCKVEGLLPTNLNNLVEDGSCSAARPARKARTATSVPLSSHWPICP